MIQLIDKQSLTFRLEKIEFNFVKPKYIILKTEFKLREGKVKNGTMWWNVFSHQFSYKQLKKAIKYANEMQ